ncbi:MAG TPA: ABC transporter substrate-binding protein [Roseomonas sp.]|nr:ABC transporter substrate-binding protein [Roseomonas sp.]
MPTRRHLLAAGGTALLGSGRSARGSTLSDALGRRLDLPAPPQRIVAIYPAMVETVFAIGAGDRVIGIGGKVQYPPEALGKPSIGGLLGFSPEAVFALRPDLVVIAIGTDADTQLRGPLIALGVPLLLADYPRFSSILRNVRLLGEALGLPARAERLAAAMEEQLGRLSAAVAGRPTPKVYLETGAAGHGSFQTVRAGHYADDVIRLAGGRNIFSGLSGPPQVTLEGIAAADPDRIVVLSSDPGWTAATIAARSGWGTLRAVRGGRVSVLPRGFMLIPGPRQIEAVSILAKTIHPEAFAA